MPIVSTAASQYAAVFASLTPSGDVTGATDYANITAALATGKPTQLGAGTFRVNQMPVLGTNHQVLEGAGRGLTTLTAVAAMRAVLQATALNNTIRDLTLDGGGLAAHELDLNRASETSVGHQIERVRVNCNQAAPVKNTGGDGTITNGAAVFTSASGVFTAADVGKWMIVTGAGPTGVALVAQILSFQSGTQVTLTANASTSVTTANYEYWGVGLNNVGCEDSTYLECVNSGSEAVPLTLNPAAFVSIPTGATDILNCRFFGPVFHNALNLNVVGGVVGPCVAVNPTGGTATVLNLDGCWVYDGGTPTAYAPIDQAAGFLAANTVTRGVHMVATNSTKWVNGTIPAGGAVVLGEGNVYVQPAANATATMTILNIVAGQTNTKSVCEGGTVSISGSATTVNYRAGGSSTHVNVQRGKINWPTHTVSATTTQPTAPAVPATTSAFTNPFGCTCAVYLLSGGATVTDIKVDGTTVGSVLSATNPTCLIVRAMSTITLTYSVATPTWVWQPIV